MVDDVCDEGAKSEATWGEESARDGDSEVEVIDVHVIKDIRTRRKDDNQTHFR